MNFNTTPVLIAGAGIGGLACALALARRGMSCHVFEQRANITQEGAGIQIGPNGVHILRQLGVADALAPQTSSPVSLRIMDGVSGRELACLALGETIEQRHGAPYWTAHRADLHSALLTKAQANPLISFSLGSGVAAAISNSDCVELNLSDGCRIEGPALIAADGMWSRLRETIFNTPALQYDLQYSGSRAYRAVIPAAQLPTELSAASTHIWLSPHAHAVHYPVRAGQEVAIIAVFADTDPAPGWGTEVLADSLQARFANSAPTLRALMMRAPIWRGWPLMTLARSTPWVDGRIALLGDAAHPILPFLAQGAVMALEDAMVLARHLESAPGAIPAVLSSYARQRIPRTTRVARAAQRNGQTYHLAGPMAAVRNAVLRASAPHRLLARYDWLYGWRAER